MSRSLNSWQGIGNLTKDVETKEVNGRAVSKFTVATGESWKDKQTGETKTNTTYHNVTLWQHEGILQYLTKGQKVYVQGPINTRSYETESGKKYITEVNAKEVMLLGGGSREEKTAVTVPDFEPEESDASLPF